MGILSRRKTRGPEPESGIRSRTVLASALPLSGPAGKQAWQAASGDAGWQKQAWYYYDTVGELRFAFNWLANAVSRATLYAAETDPGTGLITGPTEDPRAQAAAAAILGGTEDRPQNQSTMALHWQVSGETFILVIPQDPENGTAQPDRWIVLSRRGMKHAGGAWSFKDPLTGVWTKLREGVDRLLRVWSPHPDEQTSADSAMRAGNPICNEIEKCSQNIIARLDSRIAGNGVMFIPQEIDFPVGEGEQANAASLMNLLMDAAEASIGEPGTAKAQVPIMVQVPAEMIPALAEGHVDLSTQLDGQITELRDNAVTRLGRTVDMPREVALGQVAESNHWSAWQVEETTYKIHVEPFLLKLGMAFTKQYFRPALAAMGVSDPERFVLAWDITEVVSRPDNTDNVKYLRSEGLVSDDWVRSEFSVPDDAIPSDDERMRNLAERLVTAAPTVLENPSVAALLGLEATASPEAVPAALPVTEDTAGRALPEQGAEPDAALMAAAGMLSRHAFERAGARLLTRQYKGQFVSTPKWELHTVIPFDAGNSELDRLTEGSFEFSDNIAQAFGLHPARFRSALLDYVRNQLRWGEAHDPEILRRYLR